MTVPVPQGLRDVLARQVPAPGMPTGEAWLEDLPRLVADLCRDWDLTPDGGARHGFAALVLPVVRGDGTRAALKVVWPHPEGADEHRVLRMWDGVGAVRLLAADPRRWALLIERLDADRDLDGVAVLEGCERIGGLLRTLDRPAPPWARRLSEDLHRFVGEVDALRARDARGTLFPRRLLEQGRALAVDLAAEPQVDSRLVHADLHQQNVLWRPDPGEWVAIDPQGMAADPAFAVAPVLWNRWDAVERAHDARLHLGLRVDVVCDEAGVDADRARAFAIVRCVQNALWELEAPHAGSAEDVTRAVTIIKAMQPG